MSITLIMGPMFSGKSTDLFRRLNRAKIAGQSVVLYKYAGDNRYDSDLSIASSHDGIKMMGAIPVRTLENVSIPDSVNVIGIDEGQFIDGLQSFAMNAASAGIDVIVAGLDGDYQMKPFERIIELIPVAERVLKLHAVCTKCKGEASFTGRRDSPATTIREDIGGAEKYIATCRKCH